MRKRATLTGMPQQPKTRKPLLKYAGLALFIVGMVQILWALVQILFLRQSALLNIMHGFTVGAWSVTATLGLYNYRLSKWRDKGWVWTKIQGRRTPTYIGEPTAHTEQAWHALFKDLTNTIYPVQNTAGEVVTRKMLADSMHTPVGLINDLYPADAVGTFRRDMTKLIDANAHAGWFERVRLHQRIHHPYKCEGWISGTYMKLETSTAGIMQPDRATDLDKAWYGVVRAAIPGGQPDTLLQDHWFLYNLVASADVAAKELSTCYKPFDPTALTKVIRRWQKSYLALYRN